MDLPSLLAPVGIRGFKLIVEEDPSIKATMLQVLQDEYSLAATRPGLHVSSLIHCLTKTYWDEKDGVAPLTEDATLLFSIGWGLERVLISRMHVDPMEVEGITGSIDFALPDGTPADLKTTRMAVTSSAGCSVCALPYKGHTKALTGHAYVKADPIPFVMPAGWLRQFKTYKYMQNMQWVLKPVSYDFGVVVVHLIQPVLKAYRITFTHNELVENWAWLLARKDNLREMLVHDDPQPFVHNEPYECKNCEHSLKCQLAASIEGMKKDV